MLVRSAVSAIAIAWSCFASAGPLFLIQDLGTLGGNRSVPFGINDSGDVVGDSAVVGGSNPRDAAFVYRNGVMSELPTLGGSISYARDINNAGQIVGDSALAGDQFRRAFIHENSVIRDLGSIDGSPSAATAINENGTAVGLGFLGGGAVTRSVSFANGVAGEIDPVIGNGFASGVNASGQIAITATSSDDGQEHAYLYDAGTLVDLFPMNPANTWSQATGLNDLGEVVGTRSLSNKIQRGFIYRNGTSTDIGSIGGNDFDQVVARAINNHGAVVGASDTVINFTGVRHAFLLFDGVMFDLNQIVDPESNLMEHVTLVSANAINNLGWIAAEGFDSLINESHTYLLRPRPLAEPTSVVLLMPIILIVASSGKIRRQPTRRHH